MKELLFILALFFVGQAIDGCSGAAEYDSRPVYLRMRSK